ncbi:nuclear transport factor 2 family protein [Streptomyces sp. NPDC059900]|uniref:nuclear transport factor 2 family protein n=1 Tax=Streptomyces sp. NPDC059900 TaxID=3155816 RepID=UPI0034242584
MTLPPTPAEDFVGYLRSYTAEAFDKNLPPEDVWDRYHVPDAPHVVNHEHRDRQESLKNLSAWRADQTPYELRIHEAVVDGNRAAARYTVSRSLLMQVRHTTEVVIFADLADDGRVGPTVSTARMTYGWGRPEGETRDSDARPAPATPAAVSADPAAYLTDFARLSSDGGTSLQDAYDSYHTPDAVQYINGEAMQRPAILQSLEASRKEGLAYRLDIHTSLSEAGRFAARYTMVPVEGRRGLGDLEVFSFGEFADDGRVRLLRSVMQTGSGYWPT